MTYNNPVSISVNDLLSFLNSSFTILLTVLLSTESLKLSLSHVLTDYLDLHQLQPVDQSDYQMCLH